MTYDDDTPEIVKRWRTCEWKKAYTLEEAREQARRCNLNYYKCRYCGKYHVTDTYSYECIMGMEYGN